MRRFRLATAERIAEALVEALRPSCERIEIAGSIRRQAPAVKDIELVAIPSSEDRRVGQVALFGAGERETVNLAWEAIEEIGPERVQPIKPGGKDLEPDLEWRKKKTAPSRYFRLWLPKPRIKVDLFFARPQNFGLVLAIRTGCGDFSRALLARWKKVSGGGQSRECMLHRPDLTAEPTPEEVDVFNLCKVRPVPPPLRTSPRALWDACEHLPPAGRRADG